MLGHQTTPKKISNRIKNWVKGFTNGNIGYVQVLPKGPPGQCFINCSKLVHENGGEILQGWVIWEGAEILEAEHHSIYKSLDGRVYDPTFTMDGEKKILFLQDKTINASIRGQVVERCGNIIYPDTAKKRIQSQWLLEALECEITDKMETKNPIESIEGLYDSLDKAFEVMNR
jgi:hypothetical protein